MIDGSHEKLRSAISVGQAISLLMAVIAVCSVVYGAGAMSNSISSTQRLHSAEIAVLQQEGNAIRMSAAEQADHERRITHLEASMDGQQSVLSSISAQLATLNQRFTDTFGAEKK